MKKSLAILFCFALVILVEACIKVEDVTVDFTTNITKITTTSAVVNVQIDYEGEGLLSQSGLIYGLTDTLVLIDNYSSYQSGAVFLSASGNLKAFELPIQDLEDNGYYYCRPYAIIQGSPYYGQVVKLNTLCPGMGKGPAGGYVFYEDGNGGGLEAAPFDMVTNLISYQTPQAFIWGCIGVSVLGTSSDLGTGENNTALILTACNDTESIAQRCQNYSFNGYDDWYLPSLKELELMYTNLRANNYGKFYINPYNNATNYASSSVVNADYVKTIDFTSQVLDLDGIVYKTRSFYVRPIRKF